MAKKNNTTDSKNQPIRETVDFNASACRYRHKTTDEKIDNLKNKIEVETKRTIEKMDRFDEKIRGNGKIGLEEQIRDINEKLQKDIDKKLEEASTVREVNKENIASLITLKDKIYLWMKVIKIFFITVIAITILIIGGSAIGVRLPEGWSQRIKRATTAWFYDSTKEEKRNQEIKTAAKDVLTEQDLLKGTVKDVIIEQDLLKNVMKEVIIEQDSLKESIKEQGKELKKNEDNINRIENNNE